MATKRKSAIVKANPVSDANTSIAVIDDYSITRKEARALIADALNDCALEAKGYFGTSAIVSALARVSEKFRGGK